MTEKDLAREIWKIWDMLGKIDHPETAEIYHYVNQIVQNLPELDPCPNHNGGFDCSPFCPICEGNQYA